jgi:ketosteroid isomerase-like protein
MDPIEKLLAIENIYALKARYFRTMDSKDWAGLSNCFTEDLVADFRKAPGMLAEGRENYMQSLQEALGDAPTMHHGHMPEIEIVDDNSATGIWAMDDIVELPGLSLRGWGHYHERYRLEEGEWKISHIKLTRVRLLINGEPQAI